MQQSWLLLAWLFGMGQAAETKDPYRHTATADQMIIRDQHGRVTKMGIDTGDSYRVEFQTSEGDRRGLYSWLTPDGLPHTITYQAGADGFKVLPNGDFPIALSPLPKALARQTDLESTQQNLATKLVPAFKTSDDDPSQFAKIESDSDTEIIFAEQPGIAGEIVEAESVNHTSDSEDLVATQDENLLGGQALFPQSSIPFELQHIAAEGTPVAVSRPTAVAIGGDNSTAEVNPVSSAFVGSGGIAISLPSATALTGASGLSFANPLSLSQTQHGSIAIAGGQTMVVSGISENIASKNASFLNIVPMVKVYPMITNFFFGPMASNPFLDAKILPQKPIIRANQQEDKAVS